MKDVLLRDLTASDADLGLLRRFYRSLYISGFPDPNERESLRNMARYLSLKQRNWYGQNNYHICLLMEGEQCLAVSVSDYLTVPNCGIIEFILVDETRRGQGLGRKMHEATLALLQADARRAGHDELAAVVIELNDPFKVPARDDNFDPFARAMLWHGWGYGRLAFPYVQPALSEAQRPVTCLLLGAKPLLPSLARRFPSCLVRSVVENYLIWAMRIPRPDRNPTFRAMARHLARMEHVLLEPLGRYVGRDRRKPLTIRPVVADDTIAFEHAMAIYRRAFPNGATAVDNTSFLQRLLETTNSKRLRYHLWLAASKARGPAHGLASFFTTPRFGFGGYIILEPPLAGNGLSHVLIKRMEEQMIRDHPRCREWYIECDPDSVQQRIFERLGFVRLPIKYHQPRLALPPEQRGTTLGPELALLRKRLGADYRPHHGGKAGLAHVIATILKDIYRLSEPEASACYRTALGQ